MSLVLSIKFDTNLLKRQFLSVVGRECGQPLDCDLENKKTFENTSNYPKFSVR